MKTNLFLSYVFCIQEKTKFGEEEKKMIRGRNNVKRPINVYRYVRVYKAHARTNEAKRFYIKRIKKSE